MVRNYRIIYEKLGCLFYAVAAADRDVRKEEIQALRNAIDSTWRNYEGSTDEFHTDNAEYMLFSFDYLFSEGVMAEDAYADFETYYREHALAFDKTMRRKILTTAHAIADAYRGENAQERRVLGRLERLLNLKPSPMQTELA